MNQNNITKKGRGKNTSFYHYILRKREGENLWEREFFKTHHEIKEKYGLSRATLWRICNNPEKIFRYKLSKILRSINCGRFFTRKR